MGMTQYPQCIAKPISTEQPVGIKLEDDPQFDFIEDQMMKVGSLSHGSIEWEKVEQECIKLLSTQSKDIRLLGYLLQCLHFQPTTYKTTISFKVMEQFLRLYWQDSYPVPGPRGKGPRGKFFNQIAQRFHLLIEKFDFERLDDEESKTLLEVSEAWQDALDEQELQSEFVDLVVRRIKTEVSAIQQRQKAVEVKTQQSQNEQTPVSQSVESRPDMTIDNSSDKSSKQTLLKVAEFLSEQENGRALAIRLRRYAVWGAIHSLPDHKSDGETMLRGMQADRVKDYQDLMRHPDVSLWLKVEQSLTLAPFWFDGQLMSYAIAKELGEVSWCQAIVDETQTFLTRMPSLLELKFKGGDPFVSEQVKDWLKTCVPSTSTKTSAGNDWDEVRKDAQVIAEESGIEPALIMLNQGLDSSSEPRDQFYWRLITADLLRSNKLEAMATLQYQTLDKQVKSLSVPEWEPSLMEQIKRYTASE
ncbi:type VI secretion system protein TssA [Vibrio fluminensis]|uniref:type VI secretion system protein TssA n=1 Tax=Vibrio fluminensis TaxID=2783614 RepID=UPI00188911FB|nr:type VI secretion system protein TssA [Vibrio fluminensis]